MGSHKTQHTHTLYTSSALDMERIVDYTVYGFSMSTLYYTRIGELCIYNILCVLYIVELLFC